MTQLGKGRAAAITDAELAALADALGCHPAHLEAIAKVESGGFGWYPDGRIKILFEKPWFYKLVPAERRGEAVSAGLARKTWVPPNKGGYSDQKTPDDRYRLLASAIEIDRDAALQSISIGRFQIMGFNFRICGFDSVEHMWNAFTDSEANQLKALGNFLKSKRLSEALATGDFARIEQVYNGGGLHGAYAEMMETEAHALKAGKWKGYRPGSLAVAPPAPPPKPVDEPPPPPVPDDDVGRPNWTPHDDAAPARPPPPVGKIKRAGVAGLALGFLAAVGGALKSATSDPFVIGGTIAVVAGAVGLIILWKRR